MDYDQIQAREAVTQSAIAMGDVQASHIAIYLTMIFAYISVAYIAGNKLTRLQLYATTFVFVAASAREVVNIAALASAAQLKTSQLADLDHSVITPLGGFSIWYPILIWSTGLFASIIFMWSVRHPKTE